LEPSVSERDPKFPTAFKRVLDLAELPWFGLEEGRLKLVDDSVPPVVDTHTHLALAYVRKMRVDLWRSHTCTEHYLPLSRPLDLEEYANKNFPPDDLARLKRDLSVMSVTSRGMRATHTAPNLTREMNELGVTKSVLLPIDFPFISNNAGTYLDVASKSESIVSLGSVHPFSRNIGKKLDAQLAKGALGLKVHPAVQMLPPDHPRCLSLYRECAERGLPILWHCGPVGIETKRGRACSQLEHYWKAVKACPQATFVLGHSGALQFEQGLALANEHENVWMEISCQGLGNVRRAVAEGPKGRVMFGSDWPFYHQAIPLAKVLIATDAEPGLRAAILGENAARLFGIEVPARR
jgi:predicted TIM-barrel fold metal-dependent hydrolase